MKIHLKYYPEKRRLCDKHYARQGFGGSDLSPSTVVTAVAACRTTGTRLEWTGGWRRRAGWQRCGRTYLWRQSTRVQKRMCVAWRARRGKNGERRRRGEGGGPPVISAVCCCTASHPRHAQGKHPRRNSAAGWSTLSVRHALQSSVNRQVRRAARRRQRRFF